MSQSQWGAIRQVDSAVARVIEHRRWWAATSERPVIARIDPTSACDRFAFGKHGHGRIIAMQALGCENVCLYSLQDRLQNGATGANLIGERRQAGRHALACLALGLPVQRLMLAELLK